MFSLFGSINDALQRHNSATLGFGSELVNDRRSYLAATAPLTKLRVIVVFIGLLWAIALSFESESLATPIAVALLLMAINYQIDKSFVVEFAKLNAKKEVTEMSLFHARARATSALWLKLGLRLPVSLGMSSLLAALILSVFFRADTAFIQQQWWEQDNAPLLLRMTEYSESQDAERLQQQADIDALRVAESRFIDNIGALRSAQRNLSTEAAAKQQEAADWRTRAEAERLGIKVFGDETGQANCWLECKAALLKAKNADASHSRIVGEQQALLANEQRLVQQQESVAEKIAAAVSRLEAFDKTRPDRQAAYRSELEIAHGTTDRRTGFLFRIAALKEVISLPRYQGLAALLAIAAPIVLLCVEMIPILNALTREPTPIEKSYEVQQIADTFQCTNEVDERYSGMKTRQIDIQYVISQKEHEGERESWAHQQTLWQ